MELRWIVNTETSSLYAARELVLGEGLADSALADRLREPTAELQAVSTRVGIPDATFWSYALPLSAAFSEPRKLARMVLYRCLDAEASRSDAVGAVQSAIEQLHAAFSDQFPQLDEDLPLRIRPLGEAWEARGPGMLKVIAELTDPGLIIGKVDALLVQPVTGGGGHPSLMYNSVLFEAMLANPSPNLPEPVRLAWLLAQLNCDLPRFTESIPAEHVPTLAAVSMLIPTLSAAAHVELVKFSDDLLGEAIESWRIAPEIDSLPAKLTHWWNAYVQTRPTWIEAMGELDQIVFG